MLDTYDGLMREYDELGKEFKFYDRDPLSRAPKIIGTAKQGFNLRHRLDRLLPQGHRKRGYEKVE